MPPLLWISFIISCLISQAYALDSKASQKKGIAVDRPNVLFIIADDLADRLACYGDPVAVTPQLDKLANQGVLFRNTYCQFHTCGPSRASLFSGRYPFETGYLNNAEGTYNETLPELTSLPRLFRDNGYRTVRVGKIFHMGIPRGIGASGADDATAWDVAVNNSGWDAQQKNWQKAMQWGKRNGPGVRIRYDAPDLPDEQFADGQGLKEAIRLLKTHHPDETGKPFFLAWGIYRPHPPMIVPKKHWDAIDASRIKIPEVDKNDRDDIPKINWHLPGPGYNFIPEEHARNYTHAYYAAIHFIDEMVGELVGALKEEGLAENTIIVFTSDQGFMLGEHGHWHKSSMMKESHRVPLIILDPASEERGKQVSGLVGLIDLYPTLCELAGIEAKHDLSGVSLRPQLSDVTAKTKTHEFSVGAPNAYSIRSEAHHYTEWHDDDSKVVARMLYDMKLDPGQFHNVVEDPAYRGIRDELGALLAERLSGQPRTDQQP